MKRKALEQAAEELNFFLKLDPAINVRMPASELEAKVIEAASLLEPGEEELSLSLSADLEPEALKARKEKVTAIQNTLKELGVPLFVGAGAETELNEKEETKVTETQTEVQGNTSLLEMVQETKKLADLKVIVNEEDEFMSLRESLDDYTGIAGLKTLKAEILKTLDAEVSAPKKKEGTIQTAQKREKRKGATTRICEMVCADFEITKEQIGKKLQEEGYTVADTTIDMQLRDTQKAISCLKELGKIKA